jgi:hypothetical protein
MKNLTSKQERILSELYGPFVKTDSLEEFKRILKFYLDVLIKEDDKLIMSKFYSIIENRIYFEIQKDFRFYNLEHFKENYSVKLQDFLEEVTDSLESDFIEKCILEQNSILDNTINFFFELDNYPSINVLQFVSENFFDEYKSTSKRKIEFLQDKKTVPIAIQANNIIIEYENPYPDYFKSYGYELFLAFLKNDLDNDIIILAKCSFLVNELRKDCLMNGNFTLKKIFDFLIETFDLNLGVATKFKSDFSRSKYIESYCLMKSNFEKI